MSGQTVGGLAGAAVGFFVPVIGPALGASIGSVLGGMIAPPTIVAPDIGLAQRTTVQAGLPRPAFFGLPSPVSATIIDGESKARKVTVKTKQGKGGPTIKEKKFYLTSAIGCGEPGEIIYIEYDGVPVFDIRPASMLPEGWEGYAEEIKVAQSKFLENARLYNGSEDQLPDPDLEAIHGVGNTPAFRGTAYFVHIDVDRTLTKGTAGQYRVIVASCADVTPAVRSLVDMGPAFYFPMQGSGEDLTGNLPDMVLAGAAEYGGAGVTFPELAAGATVSTGALAGGGTDYTVLVKAQVTDFEGGVLGKTLFGHYNDTVLGFYEWTIVLCCGLTGMTAVVGINNMAGAGTTLDGPEVPVDADFTLGWRLTDGTLFEMLYNGEAVASTTIAGASFGGTAALDLGGAHSASSGGYVGSAGHAVGWNRALSTAEAYQASILMGVAPTGDASLPDAPGAYYDEETGAIITDGLGSPSAELCDVTLQEIVESIAARCGVPDDKIDCSALAGIIVPGYALTQQQPGKSAIEPLMVAYQFDLPEYDGQIIARLRGGAIDFVITDDMLLAEKVDEDTVRQQQMEFPAKVSVITPEPEANYADIPQTSVRDNPDVRSTGEVSIRLTIPLPADDAMQVAEKVHKVLWAQAEGEVALPLPPDFFTMVASDAIQYRDRRWLVTKTDAFELCLNIEGKYERTLSYQSSATGQAPRPPTPPSGSIKGKTYFAAMNLPRLRTEDSSPGAYLAITGTFPGYEGAEIYLSIDDGASYQLVETITRESIMGRLVDDEPTGGEPLTVRLWDLSDELENVTADQVALGMNAAAILNDDDTAEIIGFESAHETSAGNWELSDIARPGLDTTEVTHTTGQRFVMLDFVTFLPLDASLAGKVLKFRPVTIGTPVDSNPVYDFTFLPQFASPALIDYYTDADGENYTNAAGLFYYKES